MFRTALHVRHVDGKTWALTRPLVWEGQREFFVVKAGFLTDFASIPKPVRWLLDNAGANAEAAVLHDALWRESKRRVNPAVDPWDADGVFRSVLRETGATTLTRGLMWFAVRVLAMVQGRIGRQGPSWPVKVLQLLGVFAIGSLTALGPTLVAAAGLAVYWVGNWIVAAAWWPLERHRFGNATNWPWPWKRPATMRHDDPPPDALFLILPRPASAPTGSPALVAGLALEALLGEERDITNTDIDQALAVGDFGPMEDVPV